MWQETFQKFFDKADYASAFCEVEDVFFTDTLISYVEKKNELALISLADALQQLVLICSQKIVFLALDVEGHTLESPQPLAERIEKASIQFINMAAPYLPVVSQISFYQCLGDFYQSRKPYWSMAFYSRALTLVESSTTIALEAITALETKLTALEIQSTINLGQCYLRWMTHAIAETAHKGEKATLSASAFCFLPRCIIYLEAFQQPFSLVDKQVISEWLITTKLYSQQLQWRFKLWANRLSDPESQLDQYPLEAIDALIEEGRYALALIQHSQEKLQTAEIIVDKDDVLLLNTCASQIQKALRHFKGAISAKIDPTLLSQLDTIYPNGFAALTSFELSSAFLFSDFHPTAINCLHRRQLQKHRTLFLLDTTHPVAERSRIFQEGVTELLQAALTQLCHLLGKAPVDFELCAMGSYARGEMSAYSDIDLVLLIEDESARCHPYFSALIMGVNSYLQGLGEPWQFENQFIQSLGLRLDSTDIDRIAFYINKQGEEESDLTTKRQKWLALSHQVNSSEFILINSPETLAQKTIYWLDADKNTAQHWLLATSTLQLKSVFASHTEISRDLQKTPDLHTRYIKALTASSVQWPFIGRKLLVEIHNNLRPHINLIFGKRPAEFTALKDILSALNRIIIGLHYLNTYEPTAERVSAEKTPVEADMKHSLSPALMAALLQAKNTLLALRVEYEAQKDSTYIELADLSTSHYRSVQAIYYTWILPWAYLDPVKEYDIAKVKPVNLWQPILNSLQNKTVLTEIDKRVILNGLITAASLQVQLKVSQSWLQMFWQHVIKDLFEKILPIIPCETIENLRDYPYLSITLQEALSALMTWGANPTLPREVGGPSILEELMQIGRPDAVIVFLNNGALKDPRLPARKLHTYLENYAHWPQFKDVIQTLKTNLAQYHPQFAWLQTRPLLLQAERLQLADYGNEFTGHIQTLDQKSVYLQEKAARDVFTPPSFLREERLKKINQHGVRHVAKTMTAQGEVFIKAFPEAPDWEIAVQTFARRIVGGGVAYGEFMLYLSSKQNPWPLWVSQGIPGYNLQDVLNALSDNAEVRKISPLRTEEVKDVLANIDHYSFSQLFILTVLLSFEDGKPDNFMLMPVKEGNRTRYVLVSVDNDHVFYEPVKIEASGHATLQLKSILFCLDNMHKALDPTIVETFLALDPYSTLHDWLKELEQHEHSLQELIASHKMGQTSKIDFRFPSRAIPKVWQRWEKLKKSLDSQPDLSAIDLLKHVIPRAGLTYAAALAEKKSTVAQTLVYRFDAISAGQYTTTKIQGRVVGYKTKSTIVQALAANPLNKPSQAQPQLRNIATIQTELSLVRQESEQWQKIITALQTDNFDAFTNLLFDTTKARVITTLDWRTLKDTVAQRTLLNLLIQEGVAFHDLTLHHCTELTERDLESLLKNSPLLEKLVIIDNPQLTNQLNLLIERYASHLVHLHLEALPHLTALSLTSIKKRFLQTAIDQPLVLPLLDTLIIHHCKALTLLQLDIPMLQILGLNNLPQLNEVIVNVPYLKEATIKHCKQLVRLQTQSRQLERLNLKGCDSLTIHSLWDIFTKAPQLQQVTLPKSADNLPTSVKKYPFLLGFPSNSIDLLDSEIIQIIEQVYSAPYQAQARDHCYRAVRYSMILATISQRALAKLKACDNDKAASKVNINSLIRFFTQLGIKQTTHSLEPILIRLLTNQRGDVRKSAAEALGRIYAGQGNESLAVLLVRLLKDQEGHIQKAAAEALGTLYAGQGKESLAVPLVRLLNDQNGYVRKSAAEALSTIYAGQGTESLAVLLVGLLNDQGWYVRKAAAEALGTIYAGQGKESLAVPLVGLLKDQVWDIRKAAAEALGTIYADQGKESLAVPLVVLLKDQYKYVRKAAAEALGTIYAGQGHESLAVPLVRLLNDQKEYIQKAAVKALGTIYAGEGTESLAVVPLVRLLNDQNGDVRYAAEKALGAIYASQGKESIAVPLVRLLKDQNWDVRKSAAEVLGRIYAGQSKESLAVPLVVLLKDQDWYVRKVAAEALGTIYAGQGTESLTVPLMGLLKDQNWYVRKVAAEALGTIYAGQGTESLTVPLMGLLKDQNWDVRKSAAEVLGRIYAGQSKESLAVLLVRLLNDQEGHIQKAAAEALGAIYAGQGHESLAVPLVRLLNDQEWDVRKAAAEALGTIYASQGHESLAVPLVRLLNDQDRDVRTAAAKILGTIYAGQGHESLAVPLVRLLNDQDRDVRTAAAKALGTIYAGQGEESLAVPLVGLLKDQGRHVREVAAKALARIYADQNNESLAIPLVGLLKDQEGSVRTAAAETLGTIYTGQGTESLAILLVGLLKDQNEDAREAAAKALGTIYAGQSNESLAVLLVGLLKDQEGYVRKATAEVLVTIFVGQANDQLLENLISMLQDDDIDNFLLVSNIITTFINYPMLHQKIIETRQLLESSKVTPASIQVQHTTLSNTMLVNPALTSAHSLLRSLLTTLQSQLQPELKKIVSSAETVLSQVEVWEAIQTKLMAIKNGSQHAILNLPDSISLTEKEKISILTELASASGPLKELRVQHLHINSNACLELLRQVLSKNPALEVLELGNCQLGDAGLHAITKGLKPYKQLIQLSLNDNDLTANSLSALKVFVDKSPLQRLVLGGNRLNARGIEQFIIVLTGSTCLNTLASLSFSGNPLSELGVKQLLDWLTPNRQAISVCPQLSSLYLKEVGMLDANLITLAHLLTMQGCNLKVLALEKHVFSAQTMSLILRLLKSHTHLQQFSIEPDLLIDSNVQVPLLDVELSCKAFIRLKNTAYEFCQTQAEKALAEGQYAAAVTAYQHCHRLKPDITLLRQLEKIQVADLLNTALNFSVNILPAEKNIFLQRVKETSVNLQQNWQNTAKPEAEELAAYEQHVQILTQSLQALLENKNLAENARLLENEKELPALEEIPKASTEISVQENKGYTFQNPAHFFANKKIVATTKLVSGKLPTSNTTIEFEEHFVTANGDCGFIALGISRKQLGDTLLALKDNASDREFIANVIENTLKSKDIEPCNTLGFQLMHSWNENQEKLDTVFREIRNNLTDAIAITLELDELITWLQLSNDSNQADLLINQRLALYQVEDQLAHYYKSPDMFEYYIKKLRDQELWLDYKSALLYAKSANITLYIWKKQAEDTNQLALIDYHETDVAHNEIHILFTDGFTHFNLLSRTDGENSQTIASIFH